MRFSNWARRHRRALVGTGLIGLAALALGCSGTVGSSNSSAGSGAVATPTAQIVDSVGEFFSDFHVDQNAECVGGTTAKSTLTIWTRSSISTDLKVAQISGKKETVLFEGSRKAKYTPNVLDITFHPDDKGSFWTKTFTWPKTGSVHVRATDEGYGPPLTWLGFGGVFDDDLTNICSKAQPSPSAPKSVTDGGWVSPKELSTRVAASLERNCDPATGNVIGFVGKAKAVGNSTATIRVRVGNNADAFTGVKLEPGNGPWSTSIKPVGGPKDKTWVAIVDTTGGDSRTLVNQYLSNHCDQQ